MLQGFEAVRFCQNLRTRIAEAVVVKVEVLQGFEALGCRQGLGAGSAQPVAA